MKENNVSIITGQRRSINASSTPGNATPRAGDGFASCRVKQKVIMPVKNFNHFGFPHPAR